MSKKQVAIWSMNAALVGVFICYVVATWSWKWAVAIPVVVVVVVVRRLVVRRCRT